MAHYAASVSDPNPKELEILERFRGNYIRSAPFRQDRDQASELVLEARPTVNGLLFALGSESVEDLHSAGHGEALALLNLLGRRAGDLGLTPTAGLGVIEGLLDAFEESGTRLPTSVRAPLRSVFLEGFVAGRDDRATEAEAARAIVANAAIEIVPKVSLLVLAGDLEAEVISEIVERFGHQMLKRDMSAALVDIGGLLGPAPDRAADVFTAHVASRIVGATCVFTRASERWIAAAKDARIDLDVLCFEPTFESGLRRVLPLAGLELKSTSWLPGPLRTLLKRDE